MASLPFLSATTTTTTTSSSSSSQRRPHFAKPSHFLTHAKRSRSSLRVSCSDGQNPKTETTSQDKLDRRNMLLGLGGLYGATNLMSAPGASANPIRPPQIEKCGLATNAANNQKIQESCCPPVSQSIIDYRLPPVFQMKIRPSAHRVSPEYIFKYNMAVDRMKRLPKDDPRNFMQQANIHCAYCNGAYKQSGLNTIDLQVHNSWLFFPFHRWYLYFHERILAKLIGDPTFALPFWNWDNPKGMTMPPMFLNNKALYNPNRNEEYMPPAILNLGFTDNSISGPAQIVTNNLTILHTEMVRGNADVCDFMGKAYGEGSDTPKGPGACERGSHTAVHYLIGDPKQPTREDLGNFYSAGRDPLFYCHHANVDRMWTLWQYFIPSNKIADKRITDPDFLNAAFLFYDENAQLVRVTVKDCLDNLRMGYDLERIDLPWLDYRPPSQAAGAKVRRIEASQSSKDKTVFPIVLDKIVRVKVPKAKKGKADEVLLIEDITVDTTKFLKFDVFVNDEDDNVSDLDKAAFAGTYAQVPQRTENAMATVSIKLKLTDLYDDMDVGDDDSVVVTLVPRHQGPGVTIGGIKITENPTPAKAA